jgi:hypothetical protein
MATEQEILDKALLLSVEATKNVSQKKQIGLHDLYTDTVDLAEANSYHAVKGIYPEKLFEFRSPNQTQKEADYIKNNYKQHTLPVFLDYMNTIQRPFADGNWGIDYREDEATYKSADLTFQSYVENDIPIYGSLETFIKGILPAIKTIDANGFIGVRPEEIEYELNEANEPIISNELYKPTIYYYPSKDVIEYEQNEYYLFLSCDKSVVEFGGKQVKEGNIYELYTRNAIYFIVQYGRKQDNLFRTELFFEHNIGECQVHQLKGIPTLKGDDILWQSPFSYATDLLDLVATNANFLQALVNSCVFPVKVMYGSPCEFKDSEGFICSEGRIIANGIEKTCPSCNGIGLKSRISPLGTLLLNPTTKFAVGEEKSTQDPLKYVSPEIHTLDFIDKKVASDTDKARKILHLQTSNSEVKGTENLTATGMSLDNKAMYAFVKPISDQIFEIYEFCLNAIGEQRYGDSFQGVAMSYPKTFDFKSSEDYLIDIGNAIKNNLSPAFIQLLLLQYINAYYGDNQKSTGIFKLVMSADRLLGLSQDEINMKLARGTVSKWEDILHSSVLNFINDSLNTDENFMDKDLELQIATLHDLAKKKADEINASVQPQIYTPPKA